MQREIWGKVIGKGAGGGPLHQAASRSSVTSAGVRVFFQMSRVRRGAPASAPFWPSHTPREATSSEIMLMLLSAPAAATRGEAATVAPAPPKGADFSLFLL